MRTAVRVGVGMRGRTQKRQAHHAVVDVAAVFAVVQQSHAVACLGEVGPFVRAHFKACRVPAGVAVGVPLNAAELDVVPRAGGIYVHGERGLEQRVLLVPVHMGDKVDAPGVRIEHDALLHCGAGKRALYQHTAAHGAVFFHAQLGRAVQLPHVFGVVLLQVPRVVVVGTILEHLEHIAPCAWLEHLAPGRGVVQTGECAAGVQLRFIERRGNAPPVFGDLRKGNGRRGTAGKAVVPPALGGQLCGHKAQLAVRPAEGQGTAVGQHARDRRFHRHAHQRVPCKAELVEHQNAVAVCAHQRGQRVLRIADERGVGGQHLLILLHGILVHLFNGGSGQDIVELVEQRQLPVVGQRFGGIGMGCAAGQIQRAEQLRVGVFELGQAVVALVARHGGEYAAVVFKIELAAPAGHVLSGKAAFQLFKERQRSALACAGRAGDAVSKAALQLQHLGRGAAAAVAVAVALQHVVRQRLVLEALPAAHHLPGRENAVVGGVKRGVRVLVRLFDVIFCGDEISQHLAAVDAAPVRHIVGHHVGVVPGQLRCHEVIRPALLHDLRQRAAEAEGVRQPQNAVLTAERIAEEPLAVQKLAHQAFARGHVAVGLQPHAALRLPPALGHARPDALIQGRAVALDEIVKLGLAGHKGVFGIAFHQVIHAGKAADGLFPRLGKAPQPRHVDVRVAHAGFGGVCPAAEAVVKFRAQILARVPHALGEGSAVQVPQVQQVEGAVQVLHDADGACVVVRKKRAHLVRGAQVIVKPRYVVVALGGLHAQEHIPRGCVAVDVQRQLVAFAGNRAGCKVELVVVYVQPAYQPAVHIGQKLGIVVVPDIGGAGGYQTDHAFSGAGLGQRYCAFEAVVRLQPAESVAGGKGLPACGIGVYGVPAVVGAFGAAQALHRCAPAQGAFLQRLQNGRHAVAQLFSRHVFPSLSHGACGARPGCSVPSRRRAAATAHPPCFRRTHYSTRRSAWLSVFCFACGGKLAFVALRRTPAQARAVPLRRQPLPSRASRERSNTVAAAPMTPASALTEGSTRTGVLSGRAARSASDT